MKNLISAMLGAGGVDVPDGVPAAWAGRVHALLQGVKSLKGVRHGLDDEMFAYVMHGAPLAVLHEVGQTEGIAEHLNLAGSAGAHYYGRQSEKLEASFYDEFGAVPPGVALRWARLLDACVRPNTGARYAFVLPHGVHWPEVLLMHAANRMLNAWGGARAVPRSLSHAALEALLREEGLPEASLLVAAFSSPAATFYQSDARLQMAAELGGYAEALLRHADAVRPLLRASAAEQRLHILKMLEKAGADALRVFAPEVCDLATSASKQVRAAAEPLVRGLATEMATPLKALAVEAKPEQRAHALRLLWDLGQEVQDKELQAFSRTCAEGDKAASVRALLQEWEHAASAPQAAAQYSYEVPVIDWACAMTPELNVALGALRKEAKWVNDSSDFESLREFLASPDPLAAGRRIRKPTDWSDVLKALRNFVALPGVTPAAAFKVLEFFDMLDRDLDGVQWALVQTFNAMHRKTGRPTLLELQKLGEPKGLTPNGLFVSYCYGWGDALASDWADDAVWPFFAHNLDLLVQRLKSSTDQTYSFDRAALFRAVASFPVPPERVANTLFDLALGLGKTDRALAQHALARHPAKEVRIIAALADGKAEVRMVAAQWLARLRHAPAQAALEAAVAKEKNDVAKGAMLDALQALGQPVEKYLDRDALAQEAQKLLDKGLPKEMEWFPWAAMPAVRWADSGAAVAPDVLRWMLVQAVKQKSPEPNAVLRKYCSMFEPRDREEFGQFVLDAWLREDVRPISSDEAMKRARDAAQDTYNMMRNYPQYYSNHPQASMSIEQLTAAYLPGMLQQPAGSATSTKGMLAVAAACAAERAALAAARYLKEYYGTRAAQGKALIAMLAWVEHPSAIQLMLSVGNRFRTKSFQDEAMRQAEALAERRGWTVSELADRTIPAAGFDEAGMLELSYGERRFTAKLQPDFKVALFNGEGKAIKALPEPRADEDAELAKVAKKAYASAKKEIKSIVDLQTDRLYEALCTERDWPYEDWDQYLNRHAVVRRLVQRLVWCQVEEGKVVQVFRPLEDGTLTDADDNEVKLPGSVRVRIAHDTLLPAEDVARWQQHLQDYEIVPLFQQLGKGAYTLPQALSGADEIKDFEGHLLEAFALRGRALKLGYTRGAAQDGGWFYEYEKRFPTLGLMAVIEFTGNGLPEENRTVALHQLSFSRIGAQDAGRIPLSKVPKILLSECYNDLRLLAAEGSGFDPDWEKKTAP